jgi:DNA-binding winged helix-turn-helix (wHTH) protein
MATGGAQSRQTVIRFAEFELDLSRETLSLRGIPLKLQHQPLQVLALLIQRAPEIVTRDEIRRHVWGENVHIDVERSINFCIRQIRGVLLDNPADARFIQTLPREGYRFIAAFDGIVESKIEHERSADNRFAPAKDEVEDAVARPVSHHLLIASIAIGTLAFMALAFWLMKREAVVSVAGISPVTSYPGDELEPSISPDGRQVAFSWDGEDGHRHIYVTLPGEQRPLRLTRDAGEDTYPAWSPDGKQIAFIRRQAGSEGDIMLMSSIGGPERAVHRIQLGSLVAGAGRMMAWSPDGK